MISPTLESRRCRGRIHRLPPLNRHAFFAPLRDGWVAQLAEQWTENPRVAGSIPAPATFRVKPGFTDVKRLKVRTEVQTHPVFSALV